MDISIALACIKEHRLENYATMLYHENTASTLPYHNFCHGLAVLQFAEIVCTSQGTKMSLPLAIACIFHDFNHSGGLQNDDWNVATAIQHMKDSLIDEHKILENEISSIIQSTRYPYVIEDKDLNFEQAVIRDADLLQIVNGNYIERIFIGLVRELDWSITDAKAAQHSFLQNTHLRFTESQDMFDAAKPAILSQIDAFVDVIADEC